MIAEIGTRITTYVRSHKSEVRLLLFVVALAFVVSQASNIEDLVGHFYNGLSDVGPQT